MDTIISLKNISFKNSQDDLILDHVSVDIHKQESVLILGKNGSGKSTLSRIMTGFLVPSEGEIYFSSTKLIEKSIKDIRKKVSIIFQNPDTQILGLTVRDDILFGLKKMDLSQHDIDEKIQIVSNKLNLECLLDKETSKLSGGEKQICILASILVLDPEVIILDEITTMLDPVMKENVIDLLLQIKNEKTLIIISHDPCFFRVVERILVIDNGKIIANEKKNAIINSNIFKHQFNFPYVCILNTLIQQKGIPLKENFCVDEFMENICQYI